MRNSRLRTCHLPEVTGHSLPVLPPLTLIREDSRPSNGSLSLLSASQLPERAATSQWATLKAELPLLWPRLSVGCILGSDKRLHCPLGCGKKLGWRRGWGWGICGDLKSDEDPSYRGWSVCPDSKNLQGRPELGRKGTSEGFWWWRKRLLSLYGRREWVSLWGFALIKDSFWSKGVQVSPPDRGDRRDTTAVGIVCRALGAGRGHHPTSPGSQ